MGTHSLRDPDRVKILADRLQHNPMLVRFLSRHGEASAHEQAWQIATALADIQESAGRIFDDLLPKLVATEPNTETAADLLQDIGEEFRHILYHIRDTSLFGYVDSDAK